MTILYYNGKFLPEDQVTVPVSDRGFLYGDGLFETILVHQGRPFRWAEHLARFQRGSDHLQIALPVPVGTLTRIAQQVIRENRAQEGVLRILLSRGSGPRGYSPRGAEKPNLLISISPLTTAAAAERPWRLKTASLRVASRQELSKHKTLSRLTCVMARAEAENAGAHEALILNTDGDVAEAASGNLFWIENDRVCTPPLESGALAGVTRELVLELCNENKITASERSCPPATLLKATGVFLTFSSRGLVEVDSIDEHPISRSPLLAKLRALYQAELERECPVGGHA